MFSAEFGKAEAGRYIAEGHRQLKFNQQMIRTGEQNLETKGGETMLNQCTLT